MKPIVMRMACMLGAFTLQVTAFERGDDSTTREVAIAGEASGMIGNTLPSSLTRKAPVSFFSIPEPQTVALIVGGIGLAMLLRRRH